MTSANVTRPGLCLSTAVSLALVVLGCGSAPPESATSEPAPPQAAAPAGPVAGPGETLVPVPTAEAQREFLRVNLDKLEFRPADPANDVGVMVANIDGDPGKPGYYLVVNRFPPGVMSRPHFHRDERHAIVLKGTWHTGDSETFAPDKTVPLRAGDYMRHPAGKFHYDGALDEEAVVAISGYGPSSSTVFDGGARFEKVR